MADTEYIRGKFEVRNHPSATRFMKDGFEAWAESERPSRTGGVRKEMRGSADDSPLLNIVSKIKEISPDLKDIIRQSGDPNADVAVKAMSKIGMGKKFSSPYDKMPRRHIVHGGCGCGCSGCQHHHEYDGEGLGDFLKKGVSAAKTAYSTGKKVYETAKQYSPAVKGLLSEFGGEKGAEIAAYADKIGLGRKRRGGTCGGACGGARAMHYPHHLAHGGAMHHPHHLAHGGAIHHPHHLAHGGARHRQTHAQFDYQIHGEGLGDFLKKGVSAAKSAYSTGKKIYETAKEYSPAVKGLLHEFGGEKGAEIAAYADKIGLGRRRGGASGARSHRGAIVKKVMMEHGLSLPQASKYVKEHGLY